MIEALLIVLTLSIDKVPIKYLENKIILEAISYNFYTLDEKKVNQLTKL